MICNVVDGESAGNMPKDILQEKMMLRYEERTVGMTRYWTAYAYDVSIERIIRCPKHTNVSTQDIIVDAFGVNYKIVQVQYPSDTQIPVMDLSLERLEKVYEYVPGNTRSS